MSTYYVPAEHLVPGTTILVDGDSVAAVVTGVDLRAEAIYTNVGTIYGVLDGDCFAVLS